MICQLRNLPVSVKIDKLNLTRANCIWIGLCHTAWTFLPFSADYIQMGKTYTSDQVITATKTLKLNGIQIRYPDIYFECFMDTDNVKSICHISSCIKISDNKESMSIQAPQISHSTKSFQGPFNKRNQLYVLGSCS